MCTSFATSTLIRLIRDGFDEVKEFHLAFFRRFGRSTMCLYGRADGWAPMEDGLASSCDELKFENLY